MTKLRNPQQYDDSKYSYVIIDEAHFFTSDSMFNPYTNEILSAIVNIFQNSVRVYMTATPEECLNYICEKEKIVQYSELTESENQYECIKSDRAALSDEDTLSVYREAIENSKHYRENSYLYTEHEYDFELHSWDEYYKRSGQLMYYYKFDRDYSYLNIKHFSKDDELYDKIANSSKNSEKWLIFIDDKKKCDELKKMLIKKDDSGKSIYGFEEDDVWVINSEIKKYEKSKNKNELKIYEEYTAMIENEKFKQKVLISTSVIDNGFNLKDKHLKNIVISDIDKAKCLQMVGRVRKMNEDAVINLYLKIFSKSDIKKRIDDLKRQQKAYYLWDMAYSKVSERNLEQKIFNDIYYNGEISDFKDAKHWFGRYIESPNTTSPNEIARSLIENTLMPRYNSILKEMKETTDNEQMYFEYQLRRWFNKKYDEENDIAINKNNLIAFLESYIGKYINENDKPQFRREFTDLSIKAFGEQKNDNKERISKGYGSDIIKKILDKYDLNYIIDTNGYDEHNKSYWEIKKKSDSDSPESEQDKPDTAD